MIPQSIVTTGGPHAANGRPRKAARGKPSKAEVLGLKVRDQPGQFQLIHKDKLLVDPTYQRDANPTKVETMAAT